jgi:integrase
MAMDCLAFRVLAGPSHRLYRLLTIARMQRVYDPNGEFTSHLYFVPRALLATHPILWKYPVLLAKGMMDKVPDEADRIHLLHLTEVIACARIANNSHRDVDRTRNAVARAVMFLVVRPLAHVRGGTSFRDIFPQVQSRDHLVSTLACIVGSMHKQASDKPMRRMSNGHGQQPIDRVLVFFNGIIQLGVLEDAGITRSSRILRRELVGRLFDLETGNPHWFQLSVPPRHIEPHPNITQEDAETMVSVARGMSRKSHCVILILYTVALRAGAIANMRLDDVWDGKAVRSVWSIKEKFSKMHCVRPVDVLRDAIADYIKCEYCPSFSYLFASPLRPQMQPRHVVKSIVSTVCRRANVGPYNPHQFRSLMVDLFVRYSDGPALDKAAKFLGHRSVQTTYTSYWKADPERLASHIPFFHKPEQTTADGVTTGGRGSETSMGTMYDFEVQRRQQLEQTLKHVMGMLTREQQSLVSDFRLQATNTMDETDNAEHLIDDDEIEVDPLARFLTHQPSIVCV